MSAIIRIQTDPNFVRKQHPTPILRRSFCMISCTSVTQSMVLWCTTWCSPWSSGMQIRIMQSSPDSLVRYMKSCSLFERAKFRSGALIPRFLRLKSRKYWSFCAPVERGWPVRCKSSTLSVNWNRFHVRTTSLWLQSIRRATSLVDKPSSRNVTMRSCGPVVVIVLRGTMDIHSTVPQPCPYWCFTFNWKAVIHSSAAFYP